MKQTRMHKVVIFAVSPIIRNTALTEDSPFLTNTLGISQSSSPFCFTKNHLRLPPFSLKAQAPATRTKFLFMFRFILFYLRRVQDSPCKVHSTLICTIEIVRDANLICGGYRIRTCVGCNPRVFETRAISRYANPPNIR